ncbi:hypothetical protein UlMin_044891 [Ulmus minor]
MPGTVFTPALEGLKLVRDKNGKILTKRFLEICKDILPVLDKFEGAMALAKEDIDGNISRLESTYKSNSTEFNYLYKMVKSSSCADSLLWLTRAMDFLVELFRNLLQHPNWSMAQACSDSYGKTLKKWHGPGARSVFTEVMNHAPDRKKFMDIIGGDVKGDAEKFCNTFTAILKENHNFLASIGKDNLKAQ